MEAAKGPDDPVVPKYVASDLPLFTSKTLGDWVFVLFSAMV